MNGSPSLDIMGCPLFVLSVLPWLYFPNLSWYSPLKSVSSYLPISLRFLSRLNNDISLPVRSSRHHLSGLLSTAIPRGLNSLAYLTSSNLTRPPPDMLHAHFPDSSVTKRSHEPLLISQFCNTVNHDSEPHQHLSRKHLQSALSHKRLTLNQRINF